MSGTFVSVSDLLPRFAIAVLEKREDPVGTAFKNGSSRHSIAKSPRLRSSSAFWTLYANKIESDGTVCLRRPPSSSSLSSDGCRTTPAADDRDGHEAPELPGKSPSQKKPLARSLEPGALTSQLHGLDLGHKATGIAAQERRHDAEDGVTAAADVQDVVAVGGLRRGVRLQVDAN